MAIDADEWQAFYERAREVMGPEWAATLVRVVPAAGADAVATRADLAGLEERLSLRTSRDLATVEGSLRTEMADLRGEVRTEMADLRTEVTNVRASVEATIRGQTWRLSGLLVATLGIGITLARLA